MAEIKIYNDIMSEEEKNCSQFWGMDGVCFKDISEFCASIPEDDNEINVRLFCNGGSCVEGWAIYDRLRATGKEITCTVEGKAASMATIVMLAAPKERRLAYANASILVHNPRIPGGCVGKGGMATADELTQAATRLRSMQTKMLNAYVERCGCDRDEMQALMNEDKYIDADRAMELGLIGGKIAPASAKDEGAIINNQNSEKMAKEKDEKKVEVKASLLDRALAKLGLKTIEDLAAGMDLSTSDGQTLTVEREEGEPQVGDKASPDGEFLMPDGKTIVVKDGVITDIKTDEGASGEGEGETSEEDTKVQELEQKVSELEEKVKELEQAKADAEAKAKTTEDMRILNAVKMAGGEKALAKISSTYKPQGRQNNGANASAKAEGREEVSAMRAEIEARRNGTFNKKD